MGKLATVAPLGVTLKSHKGGKITFFYFPPIRGGVVYDKLPHFFYVITQWRPHWYELAVSFSIISEFVKVKYSHVVKEICRLSILFKFQLIS